jgi:hypothetical protein
LGLQAAPTSTLSTPQTALPSLAQQLAQELDCAALAMRYTVGDEFSINLMLSLYGLMLEKGQPLPGALQLALGQALSGERREAAPPLSPVTPILFGPRAADLTLTPPKRTPSFELPQTGLLNFPPEPERFVGRLKPMLRASQALAPGSECRGVLFYGMAGAGKTACARSSWLIVTSRIALSPACGTRRLTKTKSLTIKSSLPASCSTWKRS